MSDSISCSDRYFKLIDQIVDITLQGKIRSKVQVYKMLVEGIDRGTGEIFERCLAARFAETKAQLETKIKATRILRALETIQGEWEKWQEENQTIDAIASAIQAIIKPKTGNSFTALLQAIDPNQEQVLHLEQLQQLAAALKQEISAVDNPNLAQELRQLSQGINQGITSWQLLQPHLISWIYEQNPNPLGFGGVAEQNSPWILWAKQINTPLLKELFTVIGRQEAISNLPLKNYEQELSAWVELTIVLQYLQRGLINWFDRQPYDIKVGKKLSISTFLTFSWLWNQLSQSLTNPQLIDACFQAMLQTLRTFAQRSDFPVYGGIFASFSGQYLQNTLSYLDKPLGQVAGTQEKARILTLLGYSQRTLGQYESAIIFHQQALETARQAEDTACEIANFNHLSRTYIAQKNYAEAINYSQRALILSRQKGDRLGETNALTNLGYSQVLSAKQSERAELEVYETAINYLEQALSLAEKLSDSQSKALCYASLGIAYLVSEKPQTALTYLSEGSKFAQFAGDLYLQGLNFSYLAEAYYALSLFDKAVIFACLGMYLLEQIGAKEWRQAAGLLTILQGQKSEFFQLGLKQGRSEIIALIGVDGYDHLPELLIKYQQSP